MQASAADGPRLHLGTGASTMMLQGMGLCCCFSCVSSAAGPIAAAPEKVSNKKYVVYSACLHRSAQLHLIELSIVKHLLAHYEAHGQPLLTAWQMCMALLQMQIVHLWYKLAKSKPV